MTHNTRRIGLALASLFWAGSALAGSLSTPYTDPDQYTKVPFGKHSHWAQPWRAYLETVPASTFLNGTGIVWNANGQNPELVAKMLARHGIHHVRIEVGWNSINPADETQLVNAVSLGNTLRACKHCRLRPLILLNGNQGVPCPLTMFNRTVTRAAHRGDTTVSLDSVQDLRIGYSGLSNLSDYCAAEALITKINGSTVTLSKPLPKDIPAGTSVPMATLKYRPFSKPGTDDYKATVAGWQRYVATVAHFTSYILGTTDSADKGFDMEIWNELTFGSRFLSVDNYYATPPAKYDPNSIWGNLVAATASYADAHPSDFAGVQFGDGFANTIPWPSSSIEPARITAIDKHPYAGRKTYPKDNYQGDTLNALYQTDGYVPAYTALFPEYYATALQTETIIREMAPITTDLYGTKRGRLARIANTKTIPCRTWITEVNIGPNEDHPSILAYQALAQKAKSTARYFCFFLNKGVTQLDIYATSANDGSLGDKELGLVQQNFLDYAKNQTAPYPADDTSYTSPALATAGHIASHMQQDLDPTLSTTRPLRITSLSDTHDHTQFKGDGTKAHPNLYDRDVFTFLPYQVNAHRFVIPYYVMTRDITKDADDEKFTLTVQGLHGTGATVSVYDPINDISVPVTVNARTADTLTLTLTTGDCPYLLTVQESASATPAVKKSPTP